MINKSRLIRLLQRLIHINSENPGGNEFEIANFVRAYLEDMGVKCKFHEFKPKRTNVLALLKGKDSNRTLLITPHLDTVPRGEGWNFPPFAGKLSGGKIFGLGASDCKANLAVSLEVIKSLAEEGEVLNYNLLFAATADEESGSSLGLIPLLDSGLLQADAALVLDADDFGIIVTQKGLMHLKVKIPGKRAHGAYPWLGVNAIERSCRIIQDITRKKYAYKKNPLLHPPTVNVGTIKGGDKVNMVAGWCEFELDFRFLPGSKPQDLLKGLKSSIRKHSKKFTLEIQSIQDPYDISRGHTLVTQLKRSISLQKIKPRIKGSEGATVITFFQHKDIPALATGFGSGNCAHSANEYVTVSNIYKGAQVLEDFLKNYSFK